MTEKRLLEPRLPRCDMGRPPLLLTNDDGVHSTGLRLLASALHARGFPIAILAPLKEHSASGMKLTLRDNMAFKEHLGIAEEIRKDESVPIRVFSLDGSPCDCVIVAIDGGLRARAPEISPHLCISGINRGPNLSVDVLHSGTVSAAREAGLYGLPSIAVSLATHSHEDYTDALEATTQLLAAVSEIVEAAPPDLRRPQGSGAKLPNNQDPDSVQSWFRHGNLFLNLNVPEEWNGRFQTVGLGARWYHNATDMIEKRQLGVAFEVGAATIEDEDLPNSDCNAVNSGFASVTPLASWPRNHPLGVPENILAAATVPGEDGLPNWI